MMRILILASIGAVINASLIPSYMLDYSRGLERLFGMKRETTTEKGKKERTLCDSEECKLIAKVIKESMDESIDPCDDFYEYACGKWTANNPIPENQTSWSLWSLVEKKIEKQVEEIIKTESKPDDLFAVKLSKKWFKTCMDEEAQERSGLEPLVSTLWRHGGWPLIMEEGEWDDQVYNWQIVDDQFARLLGLNALHDLDYGQISYEGNMSIVIDTPHLPPDIYQLLSWSNFFSLSDDSDENNESGEGSQERGSKEKGTNKNKHDEDDENVENSEEHDEENEDEEELRKKKMAGKENHKRLGHGRKKSNRNRRTGNYVGNGQTKIRTKRDILKLKVLHNMRKQRKHTKHRVHQSRKKKTKGKLSKHAHLSVASHVKASMKKNNLKHKGKKENHNKIASRHKNRKQDNGKEKEKLRKKKIARRKINKSLGHSKRNNKRSKVIGKHVHGRKMKNKSNITSITEKVHNNKHQRKINNHRLHHVAKKSKISKRTDNDISSNSNDIENEDNKDNESNNKDSGNDSSDNEVDNEDYDEDSGNDSSDNEVDNEDYDEDNGSVSNNDDEDTEEQDSGNADEDDSEDENNNDEDYSEDKDSNDEDEKGEDDNNDDDEDDDDDDDEDDDDDDDEEKRAQLIENYKDYILNVSLLLSKARGIEISQEKLKKDIAALIEFTITLGELTLIDDEPEETTLDDFQKSYASFGSTTANSKVNWKRKVEKIFSEAGVEIDGDEDVVTGFNYFKKLRVLLDETPNETIVNYIHWLFISKLAQLSTKELRKLSETWNGGKFYDISREEQCVQLVEISEIIGYEYVRVHFSEDIAKTARDMIDDIQKEVEYQIKEAEWMNDDTKHFILDKLVNMKNLIGYPSWFRNTTLVKRFFQGLTIGPSFYENVLNYIRYKKWKSLRKIVETDDVLEDLDPLMLNAFFIPTENSISITAADFQSPFFARNRPWNVNYGIIGVVMAHEVNHGFDNDGHLYDRTGTPMEWLAAMAAAYDQRAHCFVHQFNKYSLVKGKNVTIENYGNQTAGENIADTMGLQAVFRAYQRRERECVEPDPALPGLEKFNNEQTFFLSFANLWCESQDPDTAMRSAMYDVHSPGRLRVIGSVSNSEDFARVFNCPADSPMNPEKKCNIWI